MSYGVTIINEDGRIQIDENYTHLYTTDEASGTISQSPSGPLVVPPGYILGDLIIARMPVGSNGKLFYNSPYNTGNAPTYNFHLLRKVAGNISPPTSGFGLNVLSASGQSAFIATSRNKMFKVAIFGTLPPTSPGNVGSTLTFPYAGGTVPDLHKYWVAINNTSNVKVGFPDATEFHDDVNYVFNWSGGNAGSILVCNRTATAYVNGSIYYANGFRPFTYMIFKEMP